MRKWQGTTILHFRFHNHNICLHYLSILSSEIKIVVLVPYFKKWNKIYFGNAFGCSGFSAPGFTLEVVT